jgi:hypothetical protein
LSKRKRGQLFAAENQPSQKFDRQKTSTVQIDADDVGQLVALQDFDEGLVHRGFEGDVEQTQFRNLRRRSQNER